MLPGELTLRIPARARQLHAERMHRIGVRALLASVPVLVVAPPVATAVIGMATSAVDTLLGASVGILVPIAFVGGYTLLQARRALAEPGDLTVRVEAGRVTASIEGRDPHVRAQPLLGGQAFADHLQLTVGTLPATGVPSVTQLELPLATDERAAALDALRGIGIVLPERPSFGTHLATTLTLAGPAIAGLLVVVLVLRYVVLAVVLGALTGTAP